ncbi:MAG TPA: ribosome small subunit-dependent GTPase A [Candidatus Limnocylindrales bacterium]|jgi:ribosome biogenesis GTPase|nr:ribosome small subunit-dependent GTPase A [Candidatus Limnocylindrales bacterium]
MNGMLGLEEFGWSPIQSALFDAHASGDRLPGRVVAEDRGSYVVRLADGERRASVTGRFRFESGDDPAAFPSVGDWVVVETRDDGASVHAVLPRRTSVLRHAPGNRSVAQVIAANVDILFVVASLNADFNIRRLERYVAFAWESGADPVVILSKADLAEDLDGVMGAVEAVAVGVPILTVSAVDGRGIDELRSLIRAGATVAFVGSSGVGKSTLVNALAGEDLVAVSAIREGDARGRHTTTRRQLHLMPGGGLILDTPGMRELGLWDVDAGIDRSFADIDALTAKCRYSNCRHASDDGCALNAAVADGDLQPERLAAWRKLEGEARHLERRVNALARSAERQKWKTIHKAVGKHMEAKYGRDGW